MKIFSNLSFFLLFICSTTTVIAQQSPVDYMNSVYLPYEELEDETWEYLKAVIKGKSARTIRKKEKILVEAYSDAINRVHKVKKYENDEILKPAVLDYLRITKQMMNDEYSKIVDMEEIAEKSYDAMEAYLMAKEAVSEKRSLEYDKLSGAQKEFAAQHNVELVDGTLNERQQKIKRANKCLNYDNDLFLMFFKAHHQEGYVLEAIQQGDLTALEQSMSTLSQYAEEGLEQLKEIKSHNGDASLKDATKKVLTFYKQEAEKDLLAASDFFLLKQDFEKQKKRMDSKGKSASKEDINKFNNKVNELNSAVEGFNRVLDKVNKNRATQVNQYYKTREQFLQKNG